jgi:hypothetical protein
MNEKLMQFIWQSRFIRNGPYHLTDGSQLDIISTGLQNFNQGPDFLDARIKIGPTLWAGNIELHIHASDWYKHKHEADSNYRNIILHVVWVNDQIIYDHCCRPIHCFCLQSYVSHLLLERYSDLLSDNPFVKPCHVFLPAMNQLQWLSWKERLVVERLENKARKITIYFKAAKQDWETVTWWLLASNMGLKVNAELFLSVAQAVSLRILANHRNQIHQLEAILMGQANLLNHSFDEQYPILLQKEYQYLQKKYRLESKLIQPAFLRMRPASFPTLRLAQLAKLVQSFDHFFDSFKNAEKISSLKKKLIVMPNDYWLYHYRFDDPGTYMEKGLGNSMVNSILINTVIPLLFSYGMIMKDLRYKEKALNWLMLLGAEQNKVTKEWVNYRVTNHCAFDSQALLELRNSYCKEKRCLNCAVGRSILSVQ